MFFLLRNHVQNFICVLQDKRYCSRNNQIIARKQTINVQRYFQPGIQWVETEKTWTDSQCAKKSEQRGITLDQCKALLGPSDLSGPNVFNYSPDNHKGHCGLKKCALPIPQPERSDMGNFKGYHRGKKKHCKTSSFFIFVSEQPLFLSQ